MKNLAGELYAHPEGNERFIRPEALDEMVALWNDFKG